MTWDTLDTDAINAYYVTSHLTFSNGNLTAVSSYSPSGYQVPYAQTVEGKFPGSGKWLVGFTLNASSSPSSEDFGLISCSGSRQSSLGGFQSLGYNATGTVYVNNSLVATLASYTVGAVIVAAFDFINRKVWFWTSATGWQGSGAGANPSTNTNGIDISAVIPSEASIYRAYPAVNFFTNTTQWTVNLGQSTFPVSTPTGFTPGWTNTTNGTFFGSFATNGYGDGATEIPNGYLSASPYVCGTTGLVSSVTIPLPNVFTGIISDLVAEIWSDNSGYPGTPLATANSFSGPAGALTGPGEVTSPVSTLYGTAGTKYWLCLYAGPTSGDSNVTFPSGGVSVGTYQVASGETWPTFPSTFPSGATGYNFRTPAIFTITQPTLSSGQVIQIDCIQGGGQIQITGYADGVYSGNVVGTISSLVPNAAGPDGLTINAGGWAYGTPESVISGLSYLESASVMALADGLVEGPFIVTSGGTITLPVPATNVIVGLAYDNFVQDLPITTGEQTVTEGKRRMVQAVTLRVDAAYGLTLGPDFETQTPIPDLLAQAPYSPPPPLVSSDVRVNIQTDWNLRGQVCIQQPYPLPATILGIYKEVTFGDDQQ